MFKSYSGISFKLEHFKNKHIITRLMIGKHGYQNWRDYEGSSKTFMRQLLYGKYDSSIVWDSE